MNECKNCKHYKAATFTERGFGSVKVKVYCDPNDTIKAVGLTLTYDKKDLIECSQHNKNNDCKYYKRKWWKFWVKENKK